MIIDVFGGFKLLKEVRLILESVGLLGASLLINLEKRIAQHVIENPEKLPGTTDDLAETF